MSVLNLWLWPLDHWALFYFQELFRGRRIQNKCIRCLGHFPPLGCSCPQLYVPAGTHISCCLQLTVRCSASGETLLFPPGACPALTAGRRRLSLQRCSKASTGCPLPTIPSADKTTSQSGYAAACPMGTCHAPRCHEHGAAGWLW